MIFLDVRSGYGGAEKFFDNLCNDLSSKESLVIQKMVFDRRSISFLSLILKLMSVRRNVVIFNMSVLGIGFVYLLILKAFGNKIILYPHIVQSHTLLGSKFAFLRDINRRLSCRVSDRIIAISDGNFEALSQITSIQKVVIVYNYIRSLKKDEAHPKLNLGEFAIIGRFQNKHKQQLEFLRACCGFIKNTNLKIHFFGDGPDAQLLESFVTSKGLADKVYFHGWVSEEEIYRFKFHTVISLSAWEGLPLNLLEAYRNERLVLGKSIPGVQELLYGDFLYGNYNELEELILKVLFNQVDPALIKFNRLYVDAKYNQSHSISVLSAFLLRFGS